MADPVLWTNPMSRGRIARWMLEEVGCAHEIRQVAYGAEMRDPAYLALNPMGKVPTLSHGAVVVTEAAAICAYLADTYPDAGLAPPLGERGPYFRWLFFAAGPLEAAVTNRAMGFEAPDRSAMLGYGSYDSALDAVSGLLSERDYVTGAFSAADVYLGAQIIWGLSFGTVTPRPGFAAYAERLSARPAYARARAADDAAEAAAPM